MLLSRLEYRLMNNPVRAAIQRGIEARRLLGLGGRMPGGVALEIGCGRGVGMELILDRFGAERVHGFDLDPGRPDRGPPRGQRDPLIFVAGTAPLVAAAAGHRIFDDDAESQGRVSTKGKRYGASIL